MDTPGIELVRARTRVLTEALLVCSTVAEMSKMHLTAGVPTFEAIIGLEFAEQAVSIIAIIKDLEHARSTLLHLMLAVGTTKAEIDQAIVDLQREDESLEKLREL